MSTTEHATETAMEHATKTASKTALKTATKTVTVDIDRLIDADSTTMDDVRRFAAEHLTTPEKAWECLKGSLWLAHRGIAFDYYKWFCAEGPGLGLTADQIERAGYAALVDSCVQRATLEQVQFVCNAFNFTKEKALVRCGDGIMGTWNAFDSACNAGNLEVIEWVFGRFEMTQAEELEAVARLGGQYVNVSVEVGQWLDARLGAGTWGARHARYHPDHPDYRP